MDRYKTGKIYKIINSVDDKIYVGSTCMPLPKRLYVHKFQSKKVKALCHKHFNTVGWENVSIVLIENVNALTKVQLLEREKHYIGELKPALNMKPVSVNCPHDRLKSHCKECKGVNICSHNKFKNSCKKCNGKAICSHNKFKFACKECKGTSICVHGNHKYVCKECVQKCSHNKNKSCCKECNNFWCYECNKSFACKAGLTYHNSTKLHKKVERLMYRQIFDCEP